MELDELKATWRDMDRRLGESLSMSRAAIREVKLDKTRSALRWLGGLLWYELISGIVAALLIGSFLAANLEFPQFWIPAAVLQLAAIGTIVISIRHLALMSRIDFTAAVLSIQREIAELQAARVRTTRWILILSPLLWTPLAIVAARGVFEFDIYTAFGLGWVLANIAFGIAVIVLAIWIAREFADYFARSTVCRQIADSLSGRSLAVAQSHLDAIGRFEREEEK